MGSYTAFNVPVLLIIFNRMDTALQVLKKIREVKPSVMYLFCDAPRAGNSQEAVQVKQTREEILAGIDWDCQLHIRFLENNLGLKYAVGSAVSWMFEKEERGVIFEHDCLPHSSFFSFCEELLEYYKNDDRVYQISGNNFLFDKVIFNESYAFSRHNHIWGFATWRRAWEHYDSNMEGFEDFLSKEYCKELIPDKRIRNEYIRILKNVKCGLVETWDYQWFFSMWKNNGLGVVPKVNLVSNIGYGKLAINTFNEDHILANIPTHNIGKIIHPQRVEILKEAEQEYLKRVFPPLITRIRIVSNLLKKFGFKV
jgi:hypothetical protein